MRDLVFPDDDAEEEEENGEEEEEDEEDADIQVLHFVLNGADDVEAEAKVAESSYASVKADSNGKATLPDLALWVNNNMRNCSQSIHCYPMQRKTSSNQSSLNFCRRLETKDEVSD